MKVKKIVIYLLINFIFILSGIKNCPTDISPYPIKGDGVYTTPDSKGILEIKDGFRLLKLQGTDYEIGYQHGYLLSGEILSLMQDYMLWIVDYEDLNYDDILAMQWENFIWETSFIEELQGMYQGIIDTLPPEKRMITLPNGSKREVTLEDLMAGNTIADWLGVIFECSAFSIWGQARKDGDTITARNLDYLIDPKNSVKKLQLITVVNHNDSRKKFISATWPGAIGCFTCVNEDIISVSMNNVKKYLPSSTKKNTPRTFVLRKFIESESFDNPPQKGEEIFEENPVSIGNNFLISSAGIGKEDDKISGVLEYDGNIEHKDGRVTLRLPSNNPNLPVIKDYNHSLPYSYGIITTNHYVLRIITEPGGSSVKRYQIISELLNRSKEDGDVSYEDALFILKSVGGIYTVHSIIFQPDKAELDIFFAKPSNGAFDNPPYHVNLNDIFN